MSFRCYLQSTSAFSLVKNDDGSDIHSGSLSFTHVHLLAGISKLRLPDTDIWPCFTPLALNRWNEGHAVTPYTGRVGLAPWAWSEASPTRTSSYHLREIKVRTQPRRGYLSEALPYWLSAFRAGTNRTLQFFLNHRCFIRSRVAERQGKSPQRLLTGWTHPHWLELLGFKRFQRV